MVRQTSRAAFIEIRDNGLLSKMRFTVYHWLYHKGPATAGELEEDLDSKSAHCRLSELRDLGVVRECGVTSCPVTGHTVILWDVTKNLPSGKIRSGTGRVTRLLQQILQLEGEVKALRVENTRLKRKLATSMKVHQTIKRLRKVEQDDS